MSEKAKELSEKLISMFDADVQEVLQRIEKEDVKNEYKEKWHYMASSEVSDFWIDSLINLQNYMED